MAVVFSDKLLISTLAASVQLVEQIISFCPQKINLVSRTTGNEIITTTTFQSTWQTSCSCFVSDVQLHCQGM